MATEVELQRRLEDDTLVPWLLNDDGTDPVADAVARATLATILARLMDILSELSGTLAVGGTVDVSSDVDRDLGRVTVIAAPDDPETPGLATETTAKAIQRGTPDQEQRFEWVAVGTEDKPLYIGVAAAEADEGDDVWAITRYTWGAAPNGSLKPNAVQTRTGSWDDRAGLSW